MEANDQTPSPWQRIAWYIRALFPWRQIFTAMLASILTGTILVLLLRNRGLPTEVVVLIPWTASIGVYIGLWIAYNRRRNPK
jgi:hypothetical protein